MASPGSREKALALHSGRQKEQRLSFHEGWPGWTSVEQALRAKTTGTSVSSVVLS